MEWWIAGVVFFGALVLLLLIGVPIAFSLGLLSIAGMLVLWPNGLGLVGSTAYSVGSNYLLITVPLFILMASLLSASGMTESFFDAAQKWLGRVPGSLAVVSQVLSAVFAAAIGTSTGNAAAVGKVCIPEMLKKGYDKRLALGSIAAGGAQGILIPPSIAFIFYGLLSDTSVARLFMAGVVPGIMLTAMFIVYIVIRCYRNPALAPPIPAVNWRERLVSLKGTLGLVILIVVVLGSIYAGIATPTEAAGAGALGALALLVWGRRRKSGKAVASGMVEASRITAMVFMLLIGGMLFSRFLAYLGVQQGLIQMVTGLGISRWLIIAFIVFLGAFAGCFIDPGSIQIIFVPILAPIVQALGFDLIWFGVIFTIVLETANITPPLGYNLFVLKGIIPEINMNDLMVGMIPFLCIFFLGIVLICLFPQIALWLPNTMLK